MQFLESLICHLVNKLIFLFLYEVCVYQENYRKPEHYILIKLPPHKSHLSLQIQNVEKHNIPSLNKR